VSPDGRPVYLDASALVKLIAVEPESPALGTFLSGHPVRVSSALTRVEVMRAVGRSTLGAAGLRRAQEALARLALVRLDDAILEAAGRMPPPGLRTLDSLHLSTALSLGPDLAKFVTYDRRLAEAAAAAGLDVLAPR
jgi:predicted nucleic acid-binding protein